jgi:predicted secreted hydrolase
MFTRFFSAVLLLTVLAAPRQDWKRVEIPLAVEFPRDHGAHLEYRTEWWYATGELKADAGEARFGWQLTIFRQGLDPKEREPGESSLRARQIFAGHLAVVDLARGSIVSAERVRRAIPKLAEAKTGDLDVVLDEWTMQRRPDGVVVLDARDRETGIGIALELTPMKAPVMHGQSGVSQKGADAGNASAYMSWTRLATRGRLTLDGRDASVAGESWFDHEWGTSQLGAGIVGWDWFGLRLDDGRELMIYDLRHADGTLSAQSAATLVAADGSQRHFDSTEFQLTPASAAESNPDPKHASTWTSPRSKAVYPALWHLKLAAEGIDVTIRTKAPDCEIDGRTSTGTVYWEGPVAVEGSVRGSGYAELVGYAGSMSARF